MLLEFGGKLRNFTFLKISVTIKLLIKLLKINSKTKMDLLLNRKLLILTVISVILTIGIILLIPKIPITNNGDNGKLPKVIVGGKVVQEGIKNGVKYFFKKLLSKRHIIQKITTKSRAKKINTVVDSKRVNITKDVDDINAGLAKQLPNNRFELPNGNIY